MFKINSLLRSALVSSLNYIYIYIDNINSCHWIHSLVRLTEASLESLQTFGSLAAICLWVSSPNTGRWEASKGNRETVALPVQMPAVQATKSHHILHLSIDNKNVSNKIGRYFDRGRNYKKIDSIKLSRKSRERERHQFGKVALFPQLMDFDMIKASILDWFFENFD